MIILVIVLIMITHITLFSTLSPKQPSNLHLQMEMIQLLMKEHMAYKSMTILQIVKCT